MGSAGSVRAVPVDRLDGHHLVDPMGFGHLFRFDGHHLVDPTGFGHLFRLDLNDLGGHPGGAMFDRRTDGSVEGT